MTKSHGFAPIVGDRLSVLVLGTLPSRRSLATGHYYGHPRNQFWPIMGALFDAGPDKPYADRIKALTEAGIGVWDVLAAAERPGSLDASIENATAVANDFAGFFDVHGVPPHVFFNGRTASALFRRHVSVALDRLPEAPESHVLPSTSPAHAAMTFDEKLERWAAVKRLAQTDDVR